MPYEKKKKKKKETVVPKLQQEVKGKVDIVTIDDIKIDYTGKFQDFTAMCVINTCMLITVNIFSIPKIWNYFLV